MRWTRQRRARDVFAGRFSVSERGAQEGMPECSVCTCMLVCAFLRILCTRDRGCSKHPAFPAPSLLWAKLLAHLGRIAPPEREDISGAGHCLTYPSSPQDRLLVPHSPARRVCDLRRVLVSCETACRRTAVEIAARPRQWPVALRSNFRRRANRMVNPRA